MTMCGICWFDGRARTDERDDLRQRVKEAEAQTDAAMAKTIDQLRVSLDAANAKGHRAVTLCMEAEDRERRMAAQSIRAEKERDIVVGILTQARCYIDSPRFDEEGEFTGMVDDILRKMP